MGSFGDLGVNEQTVVERSNSLGCVLSFLGARGGISGFNQLPRKYRPFMQREGCLVPELSMA